MSPSTMPTTSIELRDVSEPGPTLSETEDGPILQVLPPTDRGAGAWKFLFASVVIEAILWGKSPTLVL